jgi:hypothetical protein
MAKKKDVKEVTEEEVVEEEEEAPKEVAKSSTPATVNASANAYE